MKKTYLTEIELECLKKLLQETERELDEVIEEKRRANQDGKLEDFALAEGLAQLELNQKIDALCREITKIAVLIRSAKVKENTSADTIEIGTRFDATIVLPNGTSEKDTYIVTTVESIEVEGAITTPVRSNFGAAVIGKKVGENFQYQAPVGTITGTIDEIKALKTPGVSITQIQKTLKK